MLLRWPAQPHATAMLADRGHGALQFLRSSPRRQETLQAVQLWSALTQLCVLFTAKSGLLDVSFSES